MIYSKIFELVLAEYSCRKVNKHDRVVYIGVKGKELNILLKGLCICFYTFAISVILIEI